MKIVKKTSRLLLSTKRMFQVKKNLTINYKNMQSTPISMMRKIVMLALFVGICIETTAQTLRGNLPIVQTNFTADPAPYVHGDTVYLYTSHDADDTPDGAANFLMRDWLLYTSTDMVNWTDHGAVASLKDFKWGPQENGAWAVQVVERDGRWYMYAPLHCNGIGVLMADSPYGPWTDPLARPLINQSLDDIDPTVWIDDDGQAYLYWGNPNLYYVKLNRDMISYSGDIVKNPDNSLPEDYQEAPWLYKSGKWYYMAYASTCCPEGLGYAMSKKPTGPWKKTGTLTGHYGQTNGNHPGIVRYKGHDYLFGHSYQLHRAVSNVFRENRSVHVTELHYNTDGTIRELPFWDELPEVQPVAALNPFNRVEAETIAWSEGVKTQRCDSVGMVVTQIHDGDYIRVRNIDFRQGASCFIISAASSNLGGSIELHLDTPDGLLVGSCPVGSTGGWNNWQQCECSVSVACGCHDLYLIFRGPHKDQLFDLDWWRFVAS